MEKQYYISSTKHSISERITKRGKVYDVYFRVILFDGTEKQIKRGGFSNKTIAKQAYIDFITENCELIKNNPFIKIKRAEKGLDIITIRELVIKYFNGIRNQIKDSTIYEKEKLFDLIILPRFADCQLKHLTKQELYNWQDELWAMKNPKTNEYYSYKYLSKIRTYFSAFLTWCAERNEGFTNYLLEIKKPKRRTAKKEMQFWTREEFNQFIAVVDNQTYRTLFSMLFFTGRRKGEVLALNYQDIKPNGIKFNKSLTRKTTDESTYKVTSTKTEKTGVTPLCEPIKKELQKYVVPKGQFYFGGETPLTDNTIRRAFNNYCEIAGVKQIRIHDLRHSFVSMLIHLGSNLPLVADLIGDTLAQVTKTYAHLYEEDKQNILQKIT